MTETRPIKLPVEQPLPGLRKIEQMINEITTSKDQLSNLSRQLCGGEVETPGDSFQKTYEVDPESGFEIIPEEDVIDDDNVNKTEESRPLFPSEELEKTEKFIEEATKPSLPHYA